MHVLHSGRLGGLSLRVAFREGTTRPLMIVPVEFWHVCTPNPWSVSFFLSPMPEFGKANTGHTVVRSSFEIETHVRRQTDKTGLGPALRAPRDYQEHPSSHPRAPGATGLVQLAGHSAPWKCFSHGASGASSWGLTCLSLDLPSRQKVGRRGAAPSPTLPPATEFCADTGAALRGSW